MKKSSKAKKSILKVQEPCPVSAKPKLSPRNSKILLFLFFVLWVVFFNKILSGTAHLWEDILYQEFPHRIFASRMLQMLRFPHWNPYTFGGMPFFSAIHTGVLYPGNLLLSFIPFNHGQLWYAMQVMIVLHVLIAGLCMFVLCRYFKLSRCSSLCACISYAFCGFFVVHIIHSLMLYILAWLPLIVLLLHKGVHKDSLKHLVAAGTLLGITVLAGHPQITFYEFLFLGSFSLYLIFKVSQRRWRHVLFLAIAFIIAVGLPMVQLLPAVELSGQSVRTEWTFEAASEGSMSFRQLYTFVIPKLFGGTNSPNPWRTELSFWLNDSFHSGFWTFWETTFYTGIVVLILALFQFRYLRKDPFILFSALWCGFSLAIALGSHFPIYRLFFEYVPGFGRFRIPSRILFTLNFLFPFLAARTIDQLRSPELIKPFFRFAAITTALFVCFGIAVLSGAIVGVWPEFTNPQYLNYAATQAKIMLLFAALFIVAVLLFKYKKINYSLLAALLLTIMTLDLFVFGYNFHIVPRSAVEYLSNTRSLVNGLRNLDSDEPFRINTREGSMMLLDRNQGMIDQLQLMEGYNPLNLHRKDIPVDKDLRFDLFNVKFKIAVDNNKGQAGLFHNTTRLPRAKMFYDYTYFDEDSVAVAYMNTPSFDYKNTLVLHHMPLQQIEHSADQLSSVEITDYTENRIKLSVRTNKPGILWLSEIWYPSWKATINGKEIPVLRANYGFRAVEIPVGTHEVEFMYNSTWFNVGLIITLLIAGTLLVFFSFQMKPWFLTMIRKQGK